jgi:uncharacterized membrane protein (UPF0127 family)
MPGVDNHPFNFAPSMMSTFLRTTTTLAAWLIVAPPAESQAGGPQSLQAITLTAGMYNIHAEVAATEEQREIGLMYRTELPQPNGMLFVFDTPALHCFWMKNTQLPLSIAFLADNGSVINVVDMQPQTLVSHCPLKPVRYALEMNQGWFDKRAIKPGFRLGGPPFQK